MEVASPPVSMPGLSVVEVDVELEVEDDVELEVEDELDVVGEPVGCGVGSSKPDVLLAWEGVEVSRVEVTGSPVSSPGSSVVEVEVDVELEVEVELDVAGKPVGYRIGTSEPDVLGSLEVGKEAGAKVAWIDDGGTVAVVGGATVGRTVSGMDAVGPPDGWRVECNVGGCVSEQLNTERR